MSDSKNAASKRAKALSALAVEREGYVRAGNKDRVTEVDSQIEALGGKAPAGRRAPRSAQSEA